MGLGAYKLEPRINQKHPIQHNNFPTQIFTVTRNFAKFAKIDPEIVKIRLRSGKSPKRKLNLKQTISEIRHCTYWFLDQISKILALSSNPMRKMIKNISQLWYSVEINWSTKPSADFGLLAKIGRLAEYHIWWVKLIKNPKF